ncbi:TPM domain-containing protein [Leptospira wolffii]|uniref:TPM domain-containing protein n=1 Tax=Leptospira wolffii TaxID=409998 RepID=UPI0002DF15AD|nr:TPM domain-containing protein [Leptospira wolffii]EPG65862.1 PF04536 family protein [Leptospira wolffii serovar Khorat str. Khorat-H2]
MRFLLFSFVIINLFCSGKERQTFKINGYVDDRTHTLSDPYIKRTNSRLSEVESSSSVKIAILIVDSIGDKNIESFVMEIANQNGVGARYVNNGILLFMSKNDQMIRISIGSGMEWVISDKLTSRIADDMVPYLREGDFETALDNSLKSIIPLATGVSWKIDSKSLRSLAKNDLNQIFQFNGALISTEKVGVRQFENQGEEFLLVKTDDDLNINLIVTRYKPSFSSLNKEKAKLITARLVKVNPITFQLLGVDP